MSSKEFEGRFHLNNVMFSRHPKGVFFTSVPLLLLLHFLSFDCCLRKRCGINETIMLLFTSFTTAENIQMPELNIERLI